MHTQAVAPDNRAKPAPPRRPKRPTSHRRLLTDRIARYAVGMGGLAIIASILGILVFIVIEVGPLLGSADVVERATIDTSVRAPGAVLSDDYRSHVALLADDGRLSVIDAVTGEATLERPILPPDEDSPRDEVRSVTRAPGQSVFLADTVQGRVVAQAVQWEITYDGDQRQVAVDLPEPVLFDISSDGRPLLGFSGSIDGSGTAAAVGILEDGRLTLARREIDENAFTGEVSENWTRHELTPPRPVETILLDTDQSALFGANAQGDLMRWPVDDGLPGAPDLRSTDHGAITLLSLLIGDRSLVVGHEDGTVSIWFSLRADGGERRLTPIRDFKLGDAPITHVAPSPRDKGFFGFDRDGRVGLFYSTSERTLWVGESPVSPVLAASFSPKADAAYVATVGQVAELDVDTAYPEISWTALFGKVWYEGYERPDYVWQSSGGTDDFESKLSLTPLMFGTLKGTLYSLFLAIPLGVLGAMYTSQFMHPNLRRYVKPTVEIMAALPSVVLGFLAGLWLAPRIERLMPALFLMLIVTPLLVIVGGMLWRRLPLVIRNRLPDGSQVALQLLFVGGAIWLSLSLNRPVEGWLFEGGFQAWLLDVSGLGYDQRNAVIVGLAMGFAVIPIIFSIAEDAFSNVPRNLVSGSLALGANRWQTVTRVVLPSASPGIFSAIMIGFGRAIGETMIVLMATGNTPIMDWNPFNGFRTLSANIAVEIPEAPHGATLYRALFLAALLLFIFTFVTNTVAELVRQRLRRRYAEL